MGFYSWKWYHIHSWRISLVRHDPTRADCTVHPSHQTGDLVRWLFALHSESSIPGRNKAESDLLESWGLGSHQSMPWCIKSIILLILWSISGTSLIGIFGAINIHFNLPHWQVIGDFPIVWVKCTFVLHHIFCGLYTSIFFLLVYFPRIDSFAFFKNSSFEERSSTWARPLRRRSRLNL